jgi:hypothetical protein
VPICASCGQANADGARFCNGCGATLAPSHEVRKTVTVPAAEALLLAGRGDLGQAEELARTAVTSAEIETDNVWFKGRTNEDLASILERTGRTDEARERLERALVTWEGTGCLPCAQRVGARDQIASLGQTTI